MSKGKARIKKIETRRAPSGVKVETYVDLAASKTRFEEWSIVQPSRAATVASQSTFELQPKLPEFGNKFGAHEQIPQDLSIVLLILDHQDALGHDGAACASTHTGSVK